MRQLLLSAAVLVAYASPALGQIVLEKPELKHPPALSPASDEMVPIDDEKGAGSRNDDGPAASTSKEPDKERSQAFILARDSYEHLLGGLEFTKSEVAETAAARKRESLPLETPLLSEDGLCSISEKYSEESVERACEITMFNQQPFSVDVPGSFLIGHIFGKHNAGVFGPAAGIGLAIRVPWVSPELESLGTEVGRHYFRLPQGTSFGMDLLVSVDVKIASLHRTDGDAPTASNDASGLFGMYFAVAPKLLSYSKRVEKQVSINLGGIVGYATDSPVGSGLLLAFQPGITAKF